MHTIHEDRFLNEALKHKLYSNKENLNFHLNYLFNNIDFVGKNVLDVGGGKGLLTFYAAIKGAQKVICLEPECDGSSKGMIEEFNNIKYSLSSTMPVELMPLTLQAYLEYSNDDEFDIVIMHNSINHLNEDACINFRKDKMSYQVYYKLFSEVYAKMRKGGKLIIADCSNRNFFNDIGLKNFLVPTIEWQKHQMPDVWISMLKEIGFVNPKVEWKTPNSFGKVGKKLMANSVVSYLTISSFKFIITK